MQIYLARDNVQAGPYTLEQLNTMLSTGEVINTDLMWHQGMVNWQTVGEMTQGVGYYQPTQLSATGTSTNNHVNTNTTQTRRVSVAELYGRPSQANEPNAPVAQTPSHDDSERWAGRHHTPQSATDAPLVYAGVMTRFLAVCINMLLLVAAVMPLQLAILDSGIDVEQFNSQNFADAQRLAEQMLVTLPQSTMTLTTLLLLGLFFVQILMIAMRGQSLGKLIVGIRVVSEKTGKVEAGQVLGVRGVVLFIIYQLAGAFGAAAFVLLLINYIFALNNAKKQGWHDKLAKTVVVKAHPNQLGKGK